MVDIGWATSQLDQVYHSEDHFKLSLAVELAKMYGASGFDWSGIPRRRHRSTSASGGRE